MTTAIPNPTDCTGVPTGCCEVQLPETLKVELRIDPNFCPCGNFDMELEYDADEERWIGDSPFCSQNIHLEFYCIGDKCEDFRLDIQFSSTGCAGNAQGIMPAHCKCEPLEVEFNQPISGDCCNGFIPPTNLTLTIMANKEC